MPLALTPTLILSLAPNPKPTPCRRPKQESLRCLLALCGRPGQGQGAAHTAPHTVLLSRIGASKGSIGLGRWKDAEDCALA